MSGFSESRGFLETLSPCEEGMEVDFVAGFGFFGWGAGFLAEEMGGS